MIGRTERAVKQMHYNGQLPGGLKIGGKLGFDKRKIYGVAGRRTAVAYKRLSIAVAEGPSN
jgi:hypothetical protein